MSFSSDDNNDLTGGMHEKQTQLIVLKITKKIDHIGCLVPNSPKEARKK